MTVSGIGRHLLKFSRTTFNQTSKRCLNKSIGVVGVPYGHGQNRKGRKEKGLQLAPDELREHALGCLPDYGFDVKDYGDVTYTPLNYSRDCHMNNYEHSMPLILEVYNMVSTVIGDGRMCITLGGDHSLAAGTICGHLNAAGEGNLALVYVDAHADLNLSSTSPSGNIHGMPVAIAAKEIQSSWTHLPELHSLRERIPLQNVGFLGLRSVDAGEAKMIKDFNVAAFTMTDVVRYGIADTLKRLLARIDPNNDKWIHLSFDTDALDPLEAPSTTVPVRGGLMLREMIYIAEELSNTDRLAAIDVVEFNPLLGSKRDVERTLCALRTTILACCGVKILGD